MPKGVRRRSKRKIKACDPFCKDQVRVALYKRHQGPHQGRLILGKTQLSGLDNKCISRTGRMKRGYWNMPFDLEREFNIEKRNLKKINDMINRGKPGFEEKDDGTKAFITAEERAQRQREKRWEQIRENAMIDPQTERKAQKSKSVIQNLNDLDSTKSGKSGKSKKKVLDPNDPKAKIQRRNADRFQKLMAKPSGMSPEEQIARMERGENESFAQFAKRVAAVSHSLEHKEEMEEVSKERKQKRRNRQMRLKRKEKQECVSPMK